ncbi:phage tail protein [Actinobacillus equuli subsp. equuli]|uniref:Phage tail protein n=1 Tax=Actinobacillus equuli subsp. equuli TaxID=202947 RepID=A0A9X4G5Y7_ACTEU|nr:phage tail protein [Actinobacillus equuli]MDE8035738.1 phage tail protein [Actinobacillus equuli subsp. equuli]
MSNPFEQALLKADDIIAHTIMQAITINGADYRAVFDEAPRIMDQVQAMEGTERTVTLYRTSGYLPRKGDRVSLNGREYRVTAFRFIDQLIVLQLE